MPLVTTPALVLHGFAYGETSKIVRLLTPELGVQSAIAKGALRPKSRVGATLQVLSEGTAQLFVKQGRELQTLAEFDVTTMRHDLARDVARFAAAAALCELVMRSAPAEAHPEIFQLVVAHLDQFAVVPRERLAAAALAALWTTVGALGFAPVLDRCAKCGAELPDGKIGFSVIDGGFLCRRCVRSLASARWLTAPHRAVLHHLTAGRDDQVDPLPRRHAVAHRRLVSNFVHTHLAEHQTLRALTFWEDLE
jgi:DNA repair protein RecO (recombination protein O)